MNTLTEKEKWDILKILEDKNHFPLMPERHRTAAVSLVAVFASAGNLEYVPEAVINRDICRMALKSADVDCTVLPLIPFSDIQKEGIAKFTNDTPAFVLYSFANIQDTQMAKDAVKADAYCLQLVPDRLLTKDLCRLAMQSPNADEKVLGFIPEKYRSLEILKMANQKFGNSASQNEIPPTKKRKLSI